MLRRREGEVAVAALSLHSVFGFGFFLLAHLILLEMAMSPARPRRLREMRGSQGRWGRRNSRWQGNGSRVLAGSKGQSDKVSSGNGGADWRQGKNLRARSPSLVKNMDGELHAWGGEKPLISSLTLPLKIRGASLPWLPKPWEGVPKKQVMQVPHDTFITSLLDFSNLKE